ncbi:Hypothetical protein GLP15_2523 [Giardia lamblia P15]|uniref:Uncharacterized protein n=1 Tax=Giardia intestinalis (strain P15) TaxID=658858 RepID=E1EXB9_GIAIA|nr:Hypothetical protein GLP15_2523 [Giardia lamblia P15]
MRCSCDVRVVFAVIGFLLFGGITTIAQNDYLTYTTTKFPGKEGVVTEFAYPWFGNFLMFFAMSLVGIGWAYQAAKARKDKRLYGGVPDQNSDYSTENTHNLDSSTDDASDVLESFRPSKPVQRLSCRQRFMQNAWGVLIISSIFDLLASGLGSVGLSSICNVPPSVYQMLQGAIIIFTALLSRCFLKRKTTAQQNLAIFICILGLVVIAVASYLADLYFPDIQPPAPQDPQIQDYIRLYDIRAIEYKRTVTSAILRFIMNPHERRQHGIHTYVAMVEYKDGQVLTTSLSTFLDCILTAAPLTTEEGDKTNSTMLVVGIALILIGQLIYAGQFVVEEYTMSRIDAFPSQVVCIEGIYGFVISIGLVFPVLMALKIENDFDAFLFIKAEPNILIPMAIFFITVALYNGFGQTITKLISANHRTILEGLRGLVVWIFALIERGIFGKPWGEGIYSWTSAIEAVGFVVLLVGSMIYYSIIKCNCFKGSRTEKINTFAAIMEETSAAPYEVFCSETVSSSA